MKQYTNKEYLLGKVLAMKVKNAFFEIKPPNFFNFHWRRSALNSAGAFPENFGEISPQKPTYAHFIL